MSFDKELFAELLEKAKGDRSINQYALHSGVSSAHISRLMRGLLTTPPNPDTIKLLAEKAHNEITYNELMRAAGHFEGNIAKYISINEDDSSPLYSAKLTEKDEKDIAKRMEKIKKDLIEGNADGDGLSFMGEPMSEEAVESLLEALEHAERIATLANKKYIPKKYRKE